MTAGSRDTHHDPLGAPRGPWVAAVAVVDVPTRRAHHIENGRVAEVRATRHAEMAGCCRGSMFGVDLRSTRQSADGSPLAATLYPARKGQPATCRHRQGAHEEATGGTVPCGWTPRTNDEGWKARVMRIVGSPLQQRVRMTGNLDFAKFVRRSFTTGPVLARGGRQRSRTGARRSEEEDPLMKIILEQAPRRHEKHRQAVRDSVGCPYCGALPGERCVRPDGVLRLANHEERRFAWQKLVGREVGTPRRKSTSRSSNADTAPRRSHQDRPSASLAALAPGEPPSARSS
jgi:hypothetical protein